MIIKQPAVEAKANIDVVLNRILPAVLLKEKINYNKIDNYLEQFYTDADGKTDVSVDNIHNAIVQLHRQGQLSWQVAPRTQDQIRRAEMLDNLKERGASTFKNVTAAVNEFDKKAARIILDRCELFAKSARGQSHAKTSIIREKLAQELSRLLFDKKSLNFKEAEEIERKLHVYEQGLH